MARCSPLRLAILIPLILLAAGRARAGGGLLCGSAGDEFVAARAGLRREWVIQIPFDSAGRQLESVTAGDDVVVACSSDGGVHAVQVAASAAGQPRPGSLLWSKRVGRPGGLGQSAGVGTSLVTVARDLDVHAFDAQTGVLRWTCPLGHASAAAAVPAGDNVYCPMSDDGLVRLPAGLHGVVPLADANGQELDTGSPIEQPPVPFAVGDPPRVGAVWINDEGRVIAEVPNLRAGWNVRSFDTRLPGETAAEPAGPPAVRGDTIYVATRSGRLEALRPSPSSGGDLERAWMQPVFLPGVPESGPVVAGDRVIVSLGDEGIVAYSAMPDDLASRLAQQRQDAQAGDDAAANEDATAEAPPLAPRTGLLWRTPCGVVGRMVAVVGERVWFVDAVGRLASVDLATGEPRECLPLGGFTLPVKNQGGDRLVLASPDGLLVSLAPRRTVTAVPDAAAPGAADPAATPR
ncbi:MAG: PQQ-binding-like beta-propeller repeat protein [Planctomycetota bacterium]